MSIKKITSLTALLSFAVLAFTSIILYIVPQGRIAYWADWHLFGLTKTEWGDIHISTGVLFIIAIGFHIWYNWKMILAYLKDKARNLKIFTKDFNIALILTAAFVLGTYFQAPPFVWISDINTYLKDSAAREYGDPPYGHAELSGLKTFIGKMGFNPKECTDRLKKAGVMVENSSQSLAEIARLNNMSPQQVYLAMKPAGEAGKAKTMPDSPPVGMGRRSIADICQEYSLNIPAVLRGLAQNNIRATAEMSIREIAEQNNTGPADIYEAIKRVKSKK
ncbi:DUF4405 domain-containing protein [Desulfococcaceae bacterium HSG8]|nr:DUF4405 domain-containing protein [Desulfococcaceae bacterium HSG8]